MEEMDKKARDIIQQEQKKTAGLLFFLFLCAVAMVSLFVTGYGILALVFTYVPVRGSLSCNRWKWNRLSTMLEGHCDSREMQQVYEWYYSRVISSKRKAFLAEKAARACTYNENWEAAESWREQLDRQSALYEELFQAFYREDKEEFDRCWKSYRVLAAEIREKTPAYYRYHQSFDKLDVYRSYMDEGSKEFFHDIFSRNISFTQAELVILHYKEACLLMEHMSPSEMPKAGLPLSEAFKKTEHAFYYVMDKGSTMACVVRARKRLKQLLSMAAGGGD